MTFRNLLNMVYTTCLFLLQDTFVVAVFRPVPSLTYMGGTEKKPESFYGGLAHCRPWHVVNIFVKCLSLVCQFFGMTEKLERVAVKFCF
jgi:hypothetical protein